jgi:2-polyprenyl-3-methyl-5-hydroxy-6-metoxy-1,4-benzoquinol methylase
METSGFNNERQKRFWEANLFEYKGKVISSYVITYAKKYVGKKVLDIGAGDGSLIRNLSKKYKNIHVVGIDLAPKDSLVEYGDLTSLEFGERTFDTIFCTDVLEHLNDNDLDKGISEIKRVLTDNGKVIITTLNNEDLDRFTIVCPECGFRFHRQGHQQVFTLQRLEELFRNHRLEVIKYKEINFNTLAKYRFIARMLYALNFEKRLPFRFRRDIYAVFVKA